MDLVNDILLCIIITVNVYVAVMIEFQFYTIM